jgi:hypothetical protein
MVVVVVVEEDIAVVDDDDVVEDSVVASVVVVAVGLGLGGALSPPLLYFISLSLIFNLCRK